MGIFSPQLLNLLKSTDDVALIAKGVANISDDATLATKAFKSFNAGSAESIFKELNAAYKASGAQVALSGDKMAATLVGLRNLSGEAVENAHLIETLAKTPTFKALGSLDQGKFLVTASKATGAADAMATALGHAQKAGVTFGKHNIDQLGEMARGMGAVDLTGYAEAAKLLTNQSDKAKLFKNAVENGASIDTNGLKGFLGNDYRSAYKAINEAGLGGNGDIVKKAVGMYDNGDLIAKRVNTPIGQWFGEVVDKSFYAIKGKAVPVTIGVSAVGASGYAVYHFGGMAWDEAKQKFDLELGPHAPGFGPGLDVKNPDSGEVEKKHFGVFSTVITGPETAKTLDEGEIPSKFFIAVGNVNAQLVEIDVNDPASYESVKGLKVHAYKSDETGAPAYLAMGAAKHGKGHEAELFTTNGHPDANKLKQYTTPSEETLEQFVGKYKDTYQDKIKVTDKQPVAKDTGIGSTITDIKDDMSNLKLDASLFDKVLPGAMDMLKNGTMLQKMVGGVAALAAAAMIGMGVAKKEVGKIIGGVATVFGLNYFGNRGKELALAEEDVKNNFTKTVDQLANMGGDSHGHNHAAEDKINAARHEFDNKTREYLKMDPVVKPVDDHSGHDHSGHGHASLKDADKLSEVYAQLDKAGDASGKSADATEIKVSNTPIIAKSSELERIS